MRYQGKITDWKDDLGYGFVMPNGGGALNTSGQRAFVHIKNFSKPSSRPINGDLITYELATDKNQRTFAKNIAFVSRHKTQNTPYKNSTLGVKLAIIFCAFLALSVLVGKLPLLVLEIYLVLSAVTFANYALDKSASKNERRRTPEKQLHLLSLIGGWPGAALAQKLLRHKSIKKEFQTVFYTTVIINCAALVWLIFSQSGTGFMRALADVANSTGY